MPGMNLDKALTLYLVTSYTLGMIAILITYIPSLFFVVVCLFILFSVLKAFQRIAGNSLKMYIYGEIEAAKDRQVLTFIDEALNLLEKGKKEDLKALLLEQSIEVEDGNRTEAERI